MAKRPKSKNEQLAERSTATVRDARIETVAHGVRVSDAIRGVLDALVAIDFTERRKVLAWAADHYGIDPTLGG